MLGEILTAIVTPFKTDGSVDLEAFRALARHLVENGSDGLVVTGTTGEASTLTDDERLALHEGHYIVEDVATAAGIMEWQDVWMLQRCRDRDLAQESLGADDGGQFRPQHLDGHAALVLQILREVDGGHAAGAEFALDAVAVSEGGGEVGEGSVGEHTGR